MRLLKIAAGATAFLIAAGTLASSQNQAVDVPEFSVSGRSFPAADIIAPLLIAGGLLAGLSGRRKQD